ncbi:SUKH-3 domain-containing protein [Oscillospiraceae bacterium LCP25S3_F9]
MKEQEKQEVISILKKSGWTENRNVDPMQFRYDTIGDGWTVKDYGQSFYMFDKAREFLSSYGGLTIKWDIPNDSYDYDITINGDEAALHPLSLKWFCMYYKRRLYPVAIYQAMPANLLIDEDGYFYFVWDEFVYKSGNNDFIELLYNLINNNINAIKDYRRIRDYDDDDIGLTDEFVEEWDYDFSKVPDIPRPCLDGQP